MQTKILDFGNSKRFKYNLSALSKETMQHMAEDIVAVTVSPLAVWRDSTNVKMVVRDNQLQMGIMYETPENHIVAKLSLNEYGCENDNYSGTVSKILQLCMEEIYGEEYALDVQEKQQGKTL